MDLDKVKDTSMKELAETITYLEKRAYLKGFQDCKREVLYLFTVHDLTLPVDQLIQKIKNLGVK